MATPHPSLAMQYFIGKLLRIGVLISAFIVALGGILYLLQNGTQLPALHTFQGEPAQLTHIPSIFTHALQGHSRSIIQAGLLVLIFTPIARVIMSVFLFALEKDKLYVLITLFVLGVLLYSLAGDAAL